MTGFKNIEHLRRWLSERGIDTDNWGAGSAKSLEDLWQEIVAGEAQLNDSPPARIVSVVNVIVRNGSKILVEGEQELKRNHVRIRGLPLAEKIKPGENPDEAAVRGIEEELNVSAGDIRLVSVSTWPKEVVRESGSYPGLLTRYIIHLVEVEIDNLPDADFMTTETTSSEKVLHHWRWKD